MIGFYLVWCLILRSLSPRFKKVEILMQHQPVLNRDFSDIFANFSFRLTGKRLLSRCSPFWFEIFEKLTVFNCVVRETGLFCFWGWKFIGQTEFYFLFVSYSEYQKWNVTAKFSYFGCRHWSCLNFSEIWKSKPNCEQFKSVNTRDNSRFFFNFEVLKLVLQRVRSLFVNSIILSTYSSPRNYIPEFLIKFNWKLIESCFSKILVSFSTYLISLVVGVTSLFVRKVLLYGLFIPIEISHATLLTLEKWEACTASCLSLTLIALI